MPVSSFRRWPSLFADSFALALLGLLLFAPAARAADPKPNRTERKEIAKAEKEAISKLPQKYQDWLAEVQLLMTDDERAAFLALDKDYQRDAFMDRFWESRDKYKATARNEFRDRWEARIQQARAQWGGNLNDDRVKIFLLNGPPAAAFVSTCSTVLWPLEVWYYAGSDQMGQEFVVVFYKRWGAGLFRMWNPMEGLDVLFNEGGATSLGGRESHSIGEIAQNCPRDGDKLAAGVAWVASQRMGYSIIQNRIEATPQGPGGEWVATFGSYSTDIPEGAAQLPVRLDLDFPGRYQNRTVLQGVLAVTTADAGMAKLADHRSYNFVVTGELLQGGRLFDRFRYKFDFPAAASQTAPEADTQLPLLFQRYLRPGEYLMVVKLEDLNSGKLARIERTVAIPEVDKLAPPPPPSDPETARILAEANAAISNGETTVKIVPPPGELQTGMLRFDTLTTGDIAQVTFSLDDKAVLTKRKPPFSVELDLGSLPRPRHLVVTAYDAAGNQIASDETLINAVVNRFKVKLLEPRRGQRYESSLLANAQIDIPDGESLERVEYYLNETRVATLYQAPWTQPIVLPKGEPLAYVRAVAFLTDGNSTEDLVFVNSPDNLEAMDIQFVELYTSALDRQGRPVAGLTQKDFSVSEDGVRQEIARFDQVTNLPIHAAVALDVSASMADNLDQSREAALRFLQQTIQPKDRASIITFNDRPNLAVKFTKDVTTLAGGLAGLKAERGTALYDTIIFSLFYFNGVKGQRALLLLSDGKDEGSRFTFEDAQDYARRAGVTIYAIGLGDDVDRKKLEKISEETGGRAFFVQRAAELDAIYQGIEEELRSKYLIAYQSTNTSTSDEFRTVDLKVNKPGVEAKTLRGYYP
ncbi:MAG TPA: VWA domain-containing protein [Thermoanaerobaculia bacterium]|jgi:VWFA-related protein|nr:VWA domain-containing protein [Thermoanaerobaculia bacterium]